MILPPSRALLAARMESDMGNFPDLSRIKRARYIKLGPKGNWDNLCFSDNTLRLGYPQVPHEMALKGDAAPIRKIFLTQTNEGKSSDHARQVLDFYHCGEDTLWITFSGGTMWWGVAKPEVTLLDYDPVEHDKRGNRLRQMVGGWHNTGISGKTLYRTDISGFLTQKAAYRGTICDISGREYDYLLCLIKGEILPEVRAAQQAKEAMLASLEALISHLNPKDFELLVDLVFMRGGWQRMGIAGGLEKTVDLELVQPLTQERAAVQVKSDTDQAQLSDYLQQFSSMNMHRYFYVYHTSKQPLVCSNDKVKLMGPAELAQNVANFGLMDWVMQKAC